MPAAKALRPNKLRARRGEAAVRSRRTNKAKKTTAPAAHRSIAGEANGQTDTWFRIRIASTSDGMSSSAPYPSKVLSPARSVGHGGPEYPLPAQRIEQDTACNGTGADADGFRRREQANGPGAFVRRDTFHQDRDALGAQQASADALTNAER